MEVRHLMYSFLLDLFWIVLIVDLFAIGVLLVFLINTRINASRQAANTYFFISVLKTARKASSSDDAAQLLNIGRDDFISYCELKGIETPEQRKEKKEEQDRMKQEHAIKIQEDEELWRTEQEKKLEQRRIEQEEAIQKRKERLKKFGFK